MAQDSNAEQRDFWNEGPGRHWVTHQEPLDELMTGLTDALVAAAAPAPGEAVLDIGCGTGATALALAAATGETGSVLGIDISVPLLAVAEARRAAAGRANMAFERGDAQAMSLPPARFDLAVSRFGVMFFEDPVAAFRNIARALRPGGRLVFAAWAAAELNPWFTLPMRSAVARLGPPPAGGDPHAPGPMALADIERVVGILRAAGLEACAGERRTVDLRMQGGPEAAAALSMRVGPVARHLRDKQASEADAAALEAEIREALGRYASSGELRVPAAINLFWARAGSGAVPFTVGRG